MYEMLSPKDQPQRAEKSEQRNASRPSFAPGKNCRRHRRQGAGNHRAIFVSEIPANSPADRQRQSDLNEIEEHAGSWVRLF